MRGGPGPASLALCCQTVCHDSSSWANRRVLGAGAALALALAVPVPSHSSVGSGQGKRAGAAESQTAQRAVRQAMAHMYLARNGATHLHQGLSRPINSIMLPCPLPLSFSLHCGQAPAVRNTPATMSLLDCGLCGLRDATGVGLACEAMSN
jgi:hypothetical protein